ncbi:hypothetical protein SANTM175S_07169 [Streptomyces antimycoticus]
MCRTLTGRPQPAAAEGRRRRAEEGAGGHVRGVVDAGDQAGGADGGGERGGERRPAGCRAPKATAAAAAEVAWELGKECRPTVRTRGSSCAAPGRGRRTTRLTPMLDGCAPGGEAVPRSQAAGAVAGPRPRLASPAASHRAPCSPARKDACGRRRHAGSAVRSALEARRRPVGPAGTVRGGEGTGQPGTRLRRAVVEVDIWTRWAADGPATLPLWSDTPLITRSADGSGSLDAGKR